MKVLKLHDRKGPILLVEEHWKELERLAAEHFPSNWLAVDIQVRGYCVRRDPRNSYWSVEIRCVSQPRDPGPGYYMKKRVTRYAWFQGPTVIKAYEVAITHLNNPFQGFGVFE